MVEMFSCHLDSLTQKELKIFLFKNVRNVDAIRNNIVNVIWNCAAIKPSLILDPLQIVIAANRAAVAEKLGNMVTRTVSGEILFNLSLSKNISQSLQKFGIENGDALLICFLVTDQDEYENILKEIDGELCPITELKNFTDLKEVKKVYKLNNLHSESNILDVIVSRMVTKSFVSY